jgi:hypothetical protein
MDVFRHLSCEAKLRVLESLTDFDEACSLSKASPSMLSIFLQYQDRICIHYLRKNLDDGLVQDAMAVLTFPCNMRTLRKGSREDRVCAHMNKWGKKYLPDPTKPETYDVRIVFQLSRLCRWLWRYIGLPQQGDRRFPPLGIFMVT